jgi:hypothetical protein
LIRRVIAGGSVENPLHYILGDSQVPEFTEVFMRKHQEELLESCKLGMLHTQLVDLEVEVHLRFLLVGRKRQLVISQCVESTLATDEKCDWWLCS